MTTNNHLVFRLAEEGIMTVEEAMTTYGKSKVLTKNIVLGEYEVIIVCGERYEIYVCDIDNERYFTYRMID